MNGYELTRAWFDFAFENPERVHVTQGALFMWLIEANNRAGWSTKYIFNTEDACMAIGVSNRKTIWKALNDLVELGFVIMVYKSCHKHKPSVISLTIPENHSTGALDNAILNMSENRTGKETVSGLVTPQYGNGKETVSGHSLKQQTTNQETINLKPQTGAETSSAAPLKNIPVENFEETATVISLPAEKEKRKKVAQKKENELQLKFIEAYRLKFPNVEWKSTYNAKIDKIADKAFALQKEFTGYFPQDESESLTAFNAVINNLKPWYVENGVYSPHKIIEHWDAHYEYIKKHKGKNPQQTQLQKRNEELFAAVHAQYGN